MGCASREDCEGLGPNLKVSTQHMQTKEPICSLLYFVDQGLGERSRLVDAEWAISIQGEMNGKCNPTMEATSQERLKRAADLFFVLSNGTIAFQLYERLYRTLDTHPTTSINKEMLVISLVRSTQTPTQAQTARNILNKHFAPVLTAGGPCEQFLPRILDIWLDRMMGNPYLGRLQTVMNSILVSESQLDQLPRRCFSIDVVMAIFLYFGFYVRFMGGSMSDQDYEDVNSLWERTLFLAQQPFSTVLDNIDLDSHCIRNCINWCADELWQQSSAFLNFVVPSVQASPLRERASECPSLQHGQDLLHLFYFLWDRYQLSIFHKPASLASHLKAEIELGISATELLLIVCEMINRPQRHSNVAPFPTTIPHFTNTPTGFRRHCLYRVGILKSFEDKIVAHDFFERLAPPPELQFRLAVRDVRHSNIRQHASTLLGIHIERTSHGATNRFDAPDALIIDRILPIYLCGWGRRFRPARYRRPKKTSSENAAMITMEGCSKETDMTLECLSQHQEASCELESPMKSRSRVDVDRLSDICLLSSIVSSSGSYAEFKSLARRIGREQSSQESANAEL